MTTSHKQGEKQKVEIIKGFFEHEIIKINTEKFFTLSSGLELPIYLDHRRIYSIPTLRKKVTQEWARMLKSELHERYHLDAHNDENIVCSGTATAGIAPAYGLSEELKTGFIYVRDKSKGHGLKSQIEGIATSKSQYIVVDDMVVTGSSVFKNCLLLQELYSNKSILCATSISCHESKDMRSKFQEKGILFLPLFTTYEIFTLAHQNDIIDKKEYNVLIDCLKHFEHL